MNSLFKDFNPFNTLPTNQYGLVGNVTMKGDVITFNYPVSYAFPMNQIHDPYPLLIVTDIWPRMIRGVNLHYLTFPYIKYILNSNSGNKNFSYFNIKSDKYISNAFRVYYKQGIRKPKKMDSNWLLEMMAGVRRWQPNDMEKVKEDIRKQMLQKLQMKADELTNKQLQGIESYTTQTNNIINNNLNYPQTQDGLNPSSLDLQN